MFDEITTLTAGLRSRIARTQYLGSYAGEYFHILGLAEAYNYMMELIDERTQKHPEVQRVPELRSLLLLHLYRNADKHINPTSDTIFSATVVGGPKSLRDWQEAGYRTRRTQSNYPSRLRYWKSIYDQAPLIFEKRLGVVGDLFAEIGVAHQSTFISPKGKIPRRPDTTYAEVIADRMANYSATDDLVPWWMPLNYGTRFAGLDGYPSSEGLHFIEDAERTIPSILHTYANLYERFLGDIFTQASEPSADPIFMIESWIKPYVRVRREYIPIFDLARIIVFGVPF